MEVCSNRVIVAPRTAGSRRQPRHPSLPLSSGREGRSLVGENSAWEKREGESSWYHFRTERQRTRREDPSRRAAGEGREREREAKKEGEREEREGKREGEGEREREGGRKGRNHVLQSSILQSSIL